MVIIFIVVLNTETEVLLNINNERHEFDLAKQKLTYEQKEKWLWCLWKEGSRSIPTPSCETFSLISPFYCKQMSISFSWILLIQGFNKTLKKKKGPIDFFDHSMNNIRCLLKRGEIILNIIYKCVCVCIYIYI